MKEVPLSQGVVAFVDDEDYDRIIANGPWHYHCGYAHSSRLNMRMHAFIMDGVRVDHINRDKVDNRKENLRPATNQQNQGNRIGRPDAPSKYKGVAFRGDRQKPWHALITIYGKQKFLGAFRTPEEAARVYDDAARAYFGEFALTNFPTERCDEPVQGM